MSDSALNCKWGNLINHLAACKFSQESILDFNVVGIRVGNNFGVGRMDWLKLNLICLVSLAWEFLDMLYSISRRALRHSQYWWTQRDVSVSTVHLRPGYQDFQPKVAQKSIASLELCKDVITVHNLKMWLATLSFQKAEHLEMSSSWNMGWKRDCWRRGVSIPLPLTC